MAHHFRSSERQGETDEGVFGTDTAQEQAFASLDADVTEPAPVADTAQQPLDASSAMAPMPAQEAYPAVAAAADPYADPFDVLTPADVTVSSRANLPGPLALVIGAEGEGISQLVEKNCDMMVSLPMRGHIESLNASVAAGVLLYAVLNARRG